MRSLSKKLFLILILVLGLFITFQAVFARQLELDWPPSPLGTDLYNYSTLTDLIRYLYEWGIALGGLAAFVALLIAGFLYLTSVGDPQKMADARSRIVSAFFGLVLLLAAWLILNTINPDLTVLQMPPTNFEDIPNVLCDDKCAEYNGKIKKDCLVADPDCGWKNLGPGYCYYKKETNCKDPNHNDDKVCTPRDGCAPDPQCNTDSDCIWNKTYGYCYNKIGCDKGFVCVNDPDPGDEDKKGVCASPVFNNKPECNYARLWGGKNFTSGAGTTVNVDQDKNIPGNTKEGSIKAFFEDSDLEDCPPDGNGNPSITCKKCFPLDEGECKNNSACDWNGGCFQSCGEDACGCMLELYDDSDADEILSLGCDDSISPLIPAYSTNLGLYHEDADTLSWGDGRVSCVILKKP